MEELPLPRRRGRPKKSADTKPKADSAAPQPRKRTRAPKTPAPSSPVSSPSKTDAPEVIVESEAQKKDKKPPMQPLMMIPTNELAVINNLVSREMVDPSGDDDAPSPTIKLLRSTVTAIASGSDISAHKAALQRITANQPEKSDLVISQLNQIDDERMVRLVEIQDHCERALHKATMRGDITVAEVLAGWKLANTEITAIRTNKTASRERAIDGSSALEKIDASKSDVERGVVTKWEHTTPQGRELIRKRLWDLKQQVIVEQNQKAETAAKSQEEAGQQPS